MLDLSIRRVARRNSFRPSLWSRLLTAEARWRQSRHLEGLDAHLLRDIGLDPDDADATKARWDAPAHWFQ
jgi:uncharacterized protein YjiS (DUF1127 family)